LAAAEAALLLVAAETALTLILDLHSRTAQAHALHTAGPS
jgi:hypothetical protein